MEWCVRMEYPEPWGVLWLRFEDDVLTGLRAGALGPFAGTPVGQPLHWGAFKRVSRWLDRYFDGTDPGMPPPIGLSGSDFGMRVWEAVRAVPYGETVTYGELAERVVPGRRGMARAVGTALGRNPILIAVPCHRVLGQGGRLGGYAGGVALKAALLRSEGVGFRPQTKKEGPRSGVPCECL